MDAFAPVASVDDRSSMLRWEQPSKMNPWRFSSTSTIFYKDSVVFHFPVFPCFFLSSISIYFKHVQTRTRRSMSETSCPFSSINPGRSMCNDLHPSNSDKLHHWKEEMTIVTDPGTAMNLAANSGQIGYWLDSETVCGVKAIWLTGGNLSECLTCRSWYPWGWTLALLCCWDLVCTEPRSNVWSFHSLFKSLVVPSQAAKLGSKRRTKDLSVAWKEAELTTWAPFWLEDHWYAKTSTCQAPSRGMILPFLWGSLRGAPEPPSRSSCYLNSSGCNCTAKWKQCETTCQSKAGA